MDKLLPTIEVQKPEPQAKQPEPISDNVLPEPGVRIPERNDKGNMDLIDDIMEQSDDKDDIITVEERDIPDEDDVFGEAPPPRVKPVFEEEEPSQSTEFNPEPKRGKRKYTRKAPMSDKQKEHLAKIRQIAIEKRRAERERKIKEKEEAVIEKAEKKILEKKLKAEQEVINSQLKKEHVADSVLQQNGFTKQDLDNAVLSAISQYDTLRKQQKKEKRETQIKEREQAKMRETLARAIQPNIQTNDPWRNLFT